MDKGLELSNGVIDTPMEKSKQLLDKLISVLNDVPYVEAKFVAQNLLGEIDKQSKVSISQSN
jgi:hypothetical protein